jgi:predicted small lipoprotein YifL
MTMRTIISSAVLGVFAITVAGCGLFGGLSVSDVEKDIEKNAPLQLQGESSLGPDISTGARPLPIVSVNCPDNAKLDNGSHFVCKAQVTTFTADNRPTDHNARVDVNVRDDKARWSLRLTS